MCPVAKRKIIIFGSIWLSILLVLSVFFLYYMFYDGTKSVDLGFSLNQANYMTTPGPMNNYQPWTQAQADALRNSALNEFWSEVFSVATPYLLLAILILIMGSLFIVLLDRRETK